MEFQIFMWTYFVHILKKCAFLLSLWAEDSLYLPVTLKMRFDFGFVFLLPSAPNIVILFLSWKECNKFYSQGFPLLCLLLSSCPHAPSFQVQLKCPLLQEVILVCPSLDCSNVSYSGPLWWLGIHCFSCVTGSAHLLSFLERESCIVHLCASTDIHLCSDK